jgi:hypothetical protein
MPKPTGRWVNGTQWQCPKCAWVNGAAAEECQTCGESVRPPQDEPVRPPDSLDIVGYDESRVKGARPSQPPSRAIHGLTRVTRDTAMRLFGQSLRTGLNGHGERGARAWQAIAEMPESEQRAALGVLVDDLEHEGVALYSIRDDETG